MNRAFTQEYSSLVKENKDLRNVKFSPDGKIGAYVRHDNNLYMHDFESGRERKLTTTGSGTVSNDILDGYMKKN